MKALRMVFVAVLAALFVTWGAASAEAAPYGVQCPTLGVSTTTPLPGQPFTITGTNFTPGGVYKLGLQPYGSVIGTVTADASGNFTTQYTLPSNVSGSQFVVVLSGAAVSCPVDPSQLQVKALAGSTTGTNSGSGGLAFTGVDIAMMVVVAVALVGAGAFAVAGGRRRPVGAGPSAHSRS